MDDLGGIIFYIIAAIIGIAATAGKKKKTTAQKAKPKTIEEVYDDIFDDSGTDNQDLADVDIESDYAEIDVRPEYKPADIQEKQEFQFDIAKEGKYEEPMAKAFAKEGVSMTDSKMSDFAIPGDIKNNEIGSEQKSRWKFDLKKAVIYSAILKRKYY